LKEFQGNTPLTRLHFMDENKAQTTLNIGHCKDRIEVKTFCQVNGKLLRLTL